MVFFCRMDTITIFHDSEISMDAKEWFGCTVLLKVPTTANQDRINRILIHHAIVNICGVNVALENILRHDPDYLVWGSSTEQATEILRTPEIDIGGAMIVTYPWTPQHGCAILPFDGLPPPSPTLTPAKRQRGEEVMEHLKVVVLYPKLNKEDLTATFKTYASREDIPSTWNVAIRRGTVLYMWPIWMDVEGYAPGPNSTIWAQQNAMINTPFRYTLFPMDGAGTSGQAGGGGQQLALLQLGYTVQSPGSSSGDSSFALTPDSPPDSPLYGEDDPFASPAPLSRPTSWDQIIEVLESPEGYI
ncbi:unnamed protein product [Miscanthus lutarioriparius]|uniref:Uncharacterized protein n=1 Tax=Miscanthus lutarioriparius TaxID=422564 RepID=A0A811RIZ2_9POAL|nr:unnamed protein product [Miscanthus lutarioriparius]